MTHPSDFTHPAGSTHRTGSVAIEELLAHRVWVQQLARALVEDSASADDLVQDTWVAALRRGPRDARSLRGWLATVLRNLARNRRRDTYRRDRHERRVQPPAAPAATAELVARADLGATLARAVTALPEPYRAAILRRYFDDLSPSEIARATDTPVETVKSRLKRGLALLRERLGDTADDHGSWARALLPLTLLSAGRGLAPPRTQPSPAARARRTWPGLKWPGASILGGLLVSTTTKTVAAVALLLLIAVAWRLPGAENGSPGDGQGAAPAADTAAARNAPERRHVAPGDAPAGLREPALPETPISTGTLVVHVASADGAPVPNAAVRVVSWRVKVAGQRPSGRVGHMADTPDDAVADGTSNEAGVATLEGVDPGTYLLDVRAVGRAGESLRVFVGAGATTDQTVVLSESVDLACRVLDATGRPVAGAQVLAAPLGAADADAALRATTDADGNCFVRGLPRGPHFVRIRTAANVKWSGGIVDVGAVALHIVRLGATGALVGRVTSEAGDEAIAGAIVGVQVDETFDPLSRGRPRFSATAETKTDARGAFRIEGLPLASVVSVSVEAAGYVAHVEHSFPPKAIRIETDRDVSIDVRLVRTGWIRGSVSDDTGVPVAGARVVASTQGANGIETGRSDAALTSADGTFELTDVVPGSVTVSAAARDLFALEPVRLELAPGGSVRAAIRLFHGGVVEGVVRDETGAAVADALVGVAPASRPIGGAFASSDSSGAFRVTGVAPGDALVAWVSSPRGYGLSAPFALAGIATVADVAVVIADDRGSIEGVVVRADGGPVGGARVRMSRRPQGLGQAWIRSATDHVVGSDGVFVFDGLSHGTYTPTVWLPGRPVAVGAPIRLARRAHVAGARVELPKGASITGRVLDAGGMPLAGAQVAHAAFDNGGLPQPGNVSATTDAAGRFTISGLTPGLYRITVIASGFVEERAEATAGGAEALLRLRRGVPIEGRVETPNGSTPMPVPSWVFVTGESSGYWAHVAIRRDGAFRTFPLDPLETYSFRAVTSDGFLAELAEGISVGATDVVVRVLPTSAIAGRIVDALGASLGGGVPIQGFAHDAAGGVRGPSWSTRTTADGTFRAEGLPGLSYAVVVGGLGSDIVPAVAAEDVAAGTTSLVLGARRGVTLSGRVVSAAAGADDANGVAGVTVGVVFDEGAGEPSLQRALASARSGASTSPSGQFRLRGLRAGAVELIVYSVDREPFRVGVRTAPATDVEIRLPE